ncbi:MAG: hypothetical protein ACLGJB_03770 [Blastocatellia bacterium]
MTEETKTTYFYTHDSEGVRVTKIMGEEAADAFAHDYVATHKGQPGGSTLMGLKEEDKLKIADLVRHWLETH